MNVRAPSGERSFPRAYVVVDADVLAQHLAAPAVVVARDPQHLDAAVAQIRERGDGAKATPRDHRPPLEPEVEQVAVDDERRRAAGERAQKAQARALDLGRRRAEVQIGDDVAGGGQHALSLADRRRLYKPRPSVHDHRACTTTTAIETTPRRSSRRAAPDSTLAAPPA